MTSGIYLIRRIGTDECYIGQSINIERRWSRHLTMLRKGVHHARRLQNVFTKYGESAFSFEILEAPLEQNDLTSAEQTWLDRYSPSYNSAPAAGSQAGMKHSIETRAKMSAAKLGKPSPRKGATHTDEAKRRMSESRKGRVSPNRGKPSPLKGIPRPEWVRQKIAAGNTGKTLSESQRAAMSRAFKGRPWSENRRAAYERRRIAKHQETSA